MCCFVAKLRNPIFLEPIIFPVKEINTICKGPIFSRVQILYLYPMQKFYNKSQCKGRFLIWGGVLCTVILSDIDAFAKLPNIVMIPPKVCLLAKNGCSVLGWGTLVCALSSRYLALSAQLPKRMYIVSDSFCKLLIDLQSPHTVLTFIQWSVFGSLDYIFEKFETKKFGNLFWEFTCSQFFSALGARCSVLGSFAFW